MMQVQIDQLIKNETEKSTRPEVVETHISWVILYNHYAYKIKKPLKYTFLDFSTLEKRRYYCWRELTLNQRLTEGIYLDVLPIHQSGSEIHIGGSGGVAIDYALQMQKVDRNRQMNVLLQKNMVDDKSIRSLALKIANFHQQTEIIYQKDVLQIENQFNDLEGEMNYLKACGLFDSVAIIEHALEQSHLFIQKSRGLLEKRLHDGFYRDCHGDLHSRNIFLLTTPQPFDCIEFNDDFRRIDVLNEIAFLCMDLDAFRRQDLSELFFQTYHQYLPIAKTSADHQLFLYYKCYRANVRAKVASLRARGAKSEGQREQALNQVYQYLHLMDHYLQMIHVHHSY